MPSPEEHAIIATAVHESLIGVETYIAEHGGKASEYGEKLITFLRAVEDKHRSERA